MWSFTKVHVMFEILKQYPTTVAIRQCTARKTTEPGSKRSGHDGFSSVVLSLLKPCHLFRHFQSYISTVPLQRTQQNVEAGKDK